MTTGLDPNKAKTARRVIEVLEFFDEQNRHATVMDIARRYKRPQSSTSELLAILVEMGLLYKDPSSRCFTPTPRAAMLGSMFQPSLVRDGRLTMLTERLNAQTGLGVAVMGMVGLDVQIFRWLGGARPLAAPQPNGLSGGAQAPLYDSPAGWLLLSTLPPERRDGMLRRLRAEAPADHKFSPAEIAERVQACGREGWASGPAGFGASAHMCAMLLPSEPGERPMALGFVYEPSDKIDPAALIGLLQRSVQACVNSASRIVAFEERRDRSEDEPAALEPAVAHAEPHARRGDDLLQANAEEFRLRIARNQRGWPKRAQR
jgi:DNA-binding IclR family transcriptional regulator